MSYKREWGFLGFTLEWYLEYPSQTVLLTTMNVTIWHTSTIYVSEVKWDEWHQCLEQKGSELEHQVAAACPSSLQCPWELESHKLSVCTGCCGGYQRQHPGNICKMREEGSEKLEEFLQLVIILIILSLAEHRTPRLPFLWIACLEHNVLHFQVCVVLLLVWLLGIDVVFKTWGEWTRCWVTNLYQGNCEIALIILKEI